MLGGGQKTWKNLENQKDTTVRARMDKITVEQLDKCCYEMKLTRSDVIQTVIQKVFDELIKKAGSGSVEKLTPFPTSTTRRSKLAQIFYHE